MLILKAIILEQWKCNVKTMWSVKIFLSPNQHPDVVEFVYNHTQWYDPDEYL